ncbi:hypothetical protein DID88_003802 [Monilinia fructigena]|uniref:SAM domain-containing protein n=1 Tax=Monilinia fructigena TaxID=38457 RepID=A0A395IUP0_9HELO|nr:hypothetical protein DID88_003802 [Monilinia fructigena]
MDGDDPWDWLTDKVVQEFCTDQRSWEPRAASSRLPDPVYLEKIIRDNEITGDVLLIDLDDRTLRDDLQIAKLGWRSFIRYGIDQLRLRSPKYQDWLIKERVLASSAPALGQHMSLVTNPIRFPALQPLRPRTEREAEGPNSSPNEAIENGPETAGDEKRRRLDTKIPVENLDRPWGNNHLEPLFLTPSVSLNHSSIQQANTQSEQAPPEVPGDAFNAVRPTKKRDLLANAYDDPGALDKYNMLRENDEELPLYGESGSENGFDTETWEAIDEEAKERAAYLEKGRQKNQFLTPQEVEMAVDAGISDLVSQWQETKLPNVVNEHSNSGQSHVGQGQSMQIY